MKRHERAQVNAAVAPSTAWHLADACRSLAPDVASHMAPALTWQGVLACLCAQCGMADPCKTDRGGQESYDDERPQQVWARGVGTHNGTPPHEKDDHRCATYLMVDTGERLRATMRPPISCVVVASSIGHSHPRTPLAARAKRRSHLSIYGRKRGRAIACTGRAPHACHKHHCPRTEPRTCLPLAARLTTSRNACNHAQTTMRNIW